MLGSKLFRALFTLLSAVSLFGSEYDIVDLGALENGYDSSEARGLNGHNQVVGNCYNIPAFEKRAFLWSDGVMQPLGTLGGNESDAMAVNDHGQVVGWSHASWGIPRGFIWENGVMRDLGSLEPGAYTEAWAINNAGQIVGFTGVGGILHCFLWQDGTMTDLTPEGSSRCWGTGINQAGEITGQNGWAPSAYVNPFFWQEGALVMPEMPANTVSGAGRAINSYGQVAGEYYLENDRAFLWDKGLFTDLGPSGGGLWAKALGINDACHVVGQADFRAFVCRGGGLIDLNTCLPPASGWDLFAANAINNRGQIVGFGIFNGRTRGYLMTPTVESVPAPYLAAPTNGQSFFAGRNVPLEVKLASVATNVTVVEIREGEVLVSAVTNALVPGPLLRFRGSWTNPPAGLHEVYAVAWYSSGLASTSRIANVSAVLPPRLDCRRSEPGLRVGWPAATGAFLLESTTNVSIPGSWAPVTNTPEILAGTNYVDLVLTNSAWFFRLRL